MKDGYYHSSKTEARSGGYRGKHTVGFVRALLAHFRYLVAFLANREGHLPRLYASSDFVLSSEGGVYLSFRGSNRRDWRAMSIRGKLAGAQATTRPQEAPVGSSQWKAISKRFSELSGQRFFFIQRRFV